MSEFLPPERLARVCGFGLSSCADGYVFKPTSEDEVREVFDVARGSGRKVVLRGAGLSYGDASIAAEQIVLDMSAMNRILSWDPVTGVIECEAGVTLEQIWRHTLPDGWWPPVVSGTMYPTVGGSLAMNIHGKNAVAVGNIGDHVSGLDVVLPSGARWRISESAPPFRISGPQGLAPAYEHLVSSAGLLGVVMNVSLQLKKVPSGEVTVTPRLCRNWDEQFAVFEDSFTIASLGGGTDYMVSWIDAFASGNHAGRGLFHAASHVEGPPETLRAEHQDLPSTILGLFPKSQVWRILRHLNTRSRMRALNRIRHAVNKFGEGKQYRQSLAAFSFLLDYVPEWRNAYLPGGLIQYQSFVPKERAKQVFATQLEWAQRAKLEPFLAVLKRHRPDRLPFLFSPSVDGYSLALDFKVTEATWPELERLCHHMNDLVLEAGGRFYFAKDSTLRPSDVQTYLGEAALEEFRAVKQACDPEGLLTSALAERIGLVPK